jgi:surfeit locus 1 family protein
LPPQRHFGYAITWWGLAIALIGVYLAFHYQKGRLRFRNEDKS